MVKLLDCTLREGSQIIDVDAPNILKGLSNIGVEYIELGLLDTIDFQKIFQLISLCNKNSEQIVFGNFGRFDFEKLPSYNEQMPKGVRVGFKITDFQLLKNELKTVLLSIKTKGYKLFLQPCHTLSYDEINFIELIEFVNEIAPFSFAIVDSYGSMFEEDLEKYLEIIHNNLDRNIKLNFHSHNNLQLSFALSIFLLKTTGFDTIIDCSLYGLGRGGGNLNLELISAYLNKKQGKKYDQDWILATIQDYILPLKSKIDWGYSMNALKNGINDFHPNCK